MPFAVGALSSRRPSRVYHSLEMAAGLRTLRKNVLQIQVEVFHTVASAAEHGEDGPYNLAVLIANQSAAKS